MMKQILITLLFIANIANATEVTEIITTKDPYIGVQVDFSTYQPMVYLSNLTARLHPSEYVQNTNKLITTLAQAKKAKKELFRDEKKALYFVDPSLDYYIEKIISSAVYRKNNPDEYTTYIVRDNNGVEYAVPDFEVTQQTSDKLTDYEFSLIDKMKSLKEAHVVIYLKKPRLYKNKKAPFSRKELSSVFDYFISNLELYELEDIKFSERNFRLSATINIDILVFLIASMKDLHIEEIELVTY